MCRRGEKMKRRTIKFSDGIKNPSQEIPHDPHLTSPDRAVMFGLHVHATCKARGRRLTLSHEQPAPNQGMVKAGYRACFGSKRTGVQIPLP